MKITHFGVFLSAIFLELTMSGNAGATPAIVKPVSNISPADVRPVTMTLNGAGSCIKNKHSTGDVGNLSSNQIKAMVSSATVISGSDTDHTGSDTTNPPHAPNLLGNSARDYAFTGASEIYVFSSNKEPDADLQAKQFTVVIPSLSGTGDEDVSVLA